MKAQRCQYVVGMAKNSVLKTLAEPAMAVVREDADQDIETICYDDDLYADALVVASATGDHQSVRSRIIRAVSRRRIPVF